MKNIFYIAVTFCSTFYFSAKAQTEKSMQFPAPYCRQGGTFTDLNLDPGNILPAGSYAGDYNLNPEAPYSNTVITLGGDVIFNGAEVAIAKGVTIDLNGHTLTIQNGSHLFACGDLWQGIVNANGTLVIDGSITRNSIEDAVEAVRAENGAQCEITFTDFRQNYVAVSLNGGDYGSSIIYGNTFNNPSGPLANLKPPYQNSHSFAGIRPVDAEHIKIGDENNYTPANNPHQNVFAHSVYGIMAQNSSFDAIVNNMFIDMSRGSLNCRECGTAIHSVSGPGNKVTFSAGGANDTGNGILRENRFVCNAGWEGYETGIFLSGAMETHIENNIFNNLLSGGSNDDAAYSIVETDRGFAVAGYTGSYGAGGSDAALWLVSDRGDSLDFITYGGSYNDVFRSMVMNDTAFIFCGSTDSYGHGGSDVWVVKTTHAGDTLWTRAYGGAGHETGHAITTSNNGYLIAGNTASFGAYGTDALLLKINPAGDTVFTHLYGGTGNESFYTVKEFTDGSIMLGGYTDSWGNGSKDNYLVRTDHWGDELAHWRPASVGDNIIYALMINDSGNVAAAGHGKVTSESAFNVQFLTISAFCAIWMPRQLWINNWYCPGGGYGCNTQSGDLLAAELPSMAWENPTPLRDLMDYISLMKIRTLVIGVSIYAMLDDTDDPENPGNKINYDGLITSGVNRRQKLSDYIHILKTYAHVDKVLCQARARIYDEETINGNIYAVPCGGQTLYTETMIDRIIDFNNNLSHPGKFDGIILDYEYANGKYGNATVTGTGCANSQYAYINSGWDNLMTVAAYCSTLCANNNLEFDIHYWRNNITQLHSYKDEQQQADEILAHNPAHVYFEFGKEDATGQSGCDVPEHSTWPNYWHNYTLPVNANYLFARTIKYFGTTANPYISATHILHVNTNTSQQVFLENYMKGINSFPCNSNQPVYVPQVENDWVNQFLDFQTWCLGNFNSSWNVGYGQPVWFRYGLEPISWPIRINDLKPNYVPCSSIPLRAISNQSNELDRHEKQPTSISAFPNPFSNEPVRIVIPEMIETEIQEIQITDITGRNVTSLFKISKINKEGFQLLPISSDQLASGMYLCSYKQGNLFNRIKLLKR